MIGDSASRVQVADKLGKAGLSEVAAESEQIGQADQVVGEHPAVVHELGDGRDGGFDVGGAALCGETGC
jgi:hypothetical protein